MSFLHCFYSCCVPAYIHVCVCLYAPVKSSPKIEMIWLFENYVLYIFGFFFISSFLYAFFLAVMVVVCVVVVFPFCAGEFIRLYAVCIACTSTYSSMWLFNRSGKQHTHTHTCAQTLISTIRTPFDCIWSYKKSLCWLYWYFMGLCVVCGWMVPKKRGKKTNISLCILYILPLGQGLYCNLIFYSCQKLSLKK